MLGVDAFIRVAHMRPVWVDRNFLTWEVVVKDEKLQNYPVLEMKEYSPIQTAPFYQWGN